MADVTPLPRVALLDRTRAYADPDQTQELGAIAQGTELGVLEETETCYKVVLADGSSCYIAKDSAVKLGQHTAAQGSQASRPATLSADPTARQFPTTPSAAPFVLRGPHDGARNVAAWLGGFGWVWLVGGLLFAVIILIAGFGNCEETYYNSCDDQAVTGTTLAIVMAISSVFSALIFFWLRHVLLLLAEIAEVRTTEARS
jgi:hypothetical protein